MGLQRFYADRKHTQVFDNGAIGYRSGMPFDCLGPYARVENCPVLVNGVEVARLTCYASGYADTFFSVPAATSVRKQYVGGYFSADDGGPEFRVHERFYHRFYRLIRGSKP